jgi:hypothetical protein
MIDQLRRKISRGQVGYSLHAVRQMVERNITPEEIAQTVLAGEVIEDYPDDKYGPNCLVCGTAKSGRVLHVQCTHRHRCRPLSLTPCFSRNHAIGISSGERNPAARHHY